MPILEAMVYILLRPLLDDAEDEPRGVAPGAFCRCQRNGTCCLSKRLPAFRYWRRAIRCGGTAM